MENTTIKFGAELEAIVSTSLGRPYVLRECQPLHSEKSARNRRCYHKVLLSCDDCEFPMHVFLKHAKDFNLAMKLEGFLNSISSSLFEAPRFLGAKRSAGLTFAAWKYQDDVRQANRARRELNTLLPACSAAAAINQLVIPENVRTEIGSHPFWMFPMLEKIEHEIQTIPGSLDSSAVAEVLAKTKRLLTQEREIFERLDGIQSRVFCHGQLFSSTFFAPDGVPIVCDWEYPTFGYPGIDLEWIGALAEHLQKALTAAYASAMRDAGYRLSDDDVRFVARTSFIYRSLHHGLNYGSGLSTILAGLNAFEAFAAEGG